MRRGSTVVVTGALVLGALECGNLAGDEGSFGARDEHVVTGIAQQAVLGTEGTAFANPNNEVSETFAYAMKNASGTWEMMSLGVSLFNSTQFVYGCTKDNYATWRTVTVGSQTQLGPDTTGFYRSGGTGSHAYAVMLHNSLSGGYDGLAAFDSPDPCADSWMWGSRWFPTDTTLRTVDYPYALYRASDDTMWVTWVQRPSGSVTERRMYVGQFASNMSSLIGPWPRTCASDTSDLNYINADFDSRGDLHLIYLRGADSTIRHDVFHTSTHTFDCSNISLGTYAPPTVNGQCTADMTCQTIPMYLGIDNLCLKAVIEPTIAIDRSTDHLVVGFQSQGSGGCIDKAEQRIYMSTDYGAHWTFELVTGCTNSLQSRAAWAYVPGYSSISNRFHVMSSYVPGGDNRFRQVDWVSTNGGSSWSGAYMTSARSTTGTPDRCWWGDYTGVAPDLVHSKFYYTWGALPTGAPHWVAREITNDQ